MASPATPPGGPALPAFGRAARPPAPDAVRLSPSPICLVDLRRDLICSSSAPWSDLGLVWPPDGRLATSVHPDDADRLRSFLAEAPTVPMRRPAVTEVRLAAPGGWRTTRIAAMRVDGLLEDAEVMMRLS